MKNSTLVTLPLLTLAVASIFTLAGAVKIAPLGGLVIDTIGVGGGAAFGVVRAHKQKKFVQVSLTPPRKPLTSKEKINVLVYQMHNVSFINVIGRTVPGLQRARSEFQLRNIGNRTFCPQGILGA